MFQFWVNCHQWSSRSTVWHGAASSIYAIAVQRCCSSSSSGPHLTSPSWLTQPALDTTPPSDTDHPPISTFFSLPPSNWTCLVGRSVRGCYLNWQSSDPSFDTMSCLGVCMAALASPDVGLVPVHKDEECDKDSGHHSGEEMDCVINPENQVRTVK